jgi:phosphoribosylanthranilate isomerase
MLATKVLASGITHLTDARYYAAWEVDYLAFPLGSGVADAISWDYFHALREWVEGPTSVAELGEISDAEAWVPLLTEHKLNHALILHTAPADAPKIFAEAGIKTISLVHVEGYQSADDVAEALGELPDAELAILDFQHGGITLDDLKTGHPFGLPALDQLLRQRPCLLQIDLGSADPIEIKTIYPLAGFAVRGSSEEKVGFKNFDDIDGLFEGLEVFE